MQRDVDLVEIALCGAVGAVMGADIAMPRDLPLNWTVVAVLSAMGLVVGAATGSRILDWIQDRMDGLWW
jgi:hydrogenase/urease accessory protein HupE